MTNLIIKSLGYAITSKCKGLMIKKIATPKSERLYLIPVLALVNNKVNGVYRKNQSTPPLLTPITDKVSKQKMKSTHDRT